MRRELALLVAWCVVVVVVALTAAPTATAKKIDKIELSDAGRKANKGHVKTHLKLAGWNGAPKAKQTSSAAEHKAAMSGSGSGSGSTSSSANTTAADDAKRAVKDAKAAVDDERAAADDEKKTAKQAAATATKAKHVEHAAEAAETVAKKASDKTSAKAAAATKKAAAHVAADAEKTAAAAAKKAAADEKLELAMEAREKQDADGERAWQRVQDKVIASGERDERDEAEARRLRATESGEQRKQVAEAVKLEDSMAKKASSSHSIGRDERLAHATLEAREHDDAHPGEMAAPESKKEAAGEVRDDKAALSALSSAEKKLAADAHEHRVVEAEEEVAMPRNMSAALSREVRRAAASNGMRVANTTGIKAETTCAVAEQHGVRCESHTATTDDGYRLTMHRLPRENGRPVLLQHGLMDTSATWVINGNLSLAFYLHARGYDVWMGNSRGNRYAMEHETLNSTDPRFWHFSIDEHAKYDLPASVRYVRKTTRRPLAYVGHSQGATLGLMAQQSGENWFNADNVHAVVALAPIVYVAETTNPAIHLGEAAKLDKVLAPFHGKWTLARESGMIAMVCNNTRVKAVKSACAAYAKKQTQSTLRLMPKFKWALLRLLAHFPDTTSVRNIRHWNRMFRRAQFAHYNGNEIDLSRSTVPTEVFTGARDSFYGKRDVNRLVGDLRRSGQLIAAHSVDYEHIDFIWSSNACDLVYRRIEKTLAKRMHRVSTKSEHHHAVKAARKEHRGADMALASIEHELGLPFAGLLSELFGAPPSLPAGVPPFSGLPFPHFGVVRVRVPTDERESAHLLPPALPFASRVHDHAIVHVLRIGAGPAHVGVPMPLDMPALLPMMMHAMPAMLPSAVHISAHVVPHLIEHLVVPHLIAHEHAAVPHSPAEHLGTHVLRLPDVVVHEPLVDHEPRERHEQQQQQQHSSSLMDSFVHEHGMPMLDVHKDGFHHEDEFTYDDNEPHALSIVHDTAAEAAVHAAPHGSGLLIAPDEHTAHVVGAHGTTGPTFRVSEATRRFPASMWRSSTPIDEAMNKDAEHLEHAELAHGGEAHDYAVPIEHSIVDDDDDDAEHHYASFVHHQHVEEHRHHHHHYHHHQQQQQQQSTSNFQLADRFYKH